LRNIYITIFFFCHFFVYGQQSFVISGDMGVEYDWNYLNRGSIYYNDEKKEDSTSYLKTNAKIDAGNPQYVFGRFDFNLDLENILNNKSNEKIENVNFLINELFIDINFFNWVYVRAGKQRINWGTGFSYNPSDFINPPKDPTGRINQKEGVNSLKVELITPYISVSTIGVVYDLFTSFGIGGKLSTSALIPHTDLNFIIYYSFNDNLKWGLSFSTTPFVKINYMESLAIWSEAGFWFKSNKYSPKENNYNGLTYYDMDKKNRDFYFGIVCGISYDIPYIRTHVMTEYYYIHDAYTKSEYSNIIKSISESSDSDDPLRQFVYAKSSVWLPEVSNYGLNCRHYFVMSISQPSLTQDVNIFTDSFGMGLDFLWNLYDLSFIMKGEISTSIIRNCTISLDVTWGYGEKNTEFYTLKNAVTLGLAFKMGF
jgi:hypothetical protein